MDLGMRWAVQDTHNKVLKQLCAGTGDDAFLDKAAVYQTYSSSPNWENARSLSQQPYFSSFDALSGLARQWNPGEISLASKLNRTKRTTSRWLSACQCLCWLNGCHQRGNIYTLFGLGGKKWGMHPLGLKETRKQQQIWNINSVKKVCISQSEVWE